MHKTKNIMAGTTPQSDVLNWKEEPKKLPDMLNVLTILTFVGCGLGLITSIYSFFTIERSYDRLVAMQGKLDQVPGFLRKMMGPEALEMTRKSMENRIPILLLTLVAMGLCLYGAIQMRGLKRNGFAIYTIGELLPIVTGFLFVGLSSFGGFAILGTFLIPFIFIILYGTQLKHLKN